MLALSLFGTVTGLEVRSFGQIATPLSDEWLALNPGDLRLQGGCSVIGINRRVTDAGILTWIGLYRTALEMTSDRGGGYMGAGVWVLNHAVPAGPVIELLEALTQQLSSLAMSAGRFTRRIVEVERAIDWRDDIGQRMRQLIELPKKGGLGTGDRGKAFFDAATSGPAVPMHWMVNTAQLGLGLEAFRVLFMSANEEVAESVRRNGRLKLVTLDSLLSAQVLYGQHQDEELIQAQQRLEQIEHSLKQERVARKATDDQLAELRASHQAVLQEKTEIDSARRRQAEELEQRRDEIQSMRRKAEQLERHVERRERSLELNLAQLEDQRRQQRQSAEELVERARQVERRSAQMEGLSRQLAEEQSVLTSRTKQIEEERGRVREWESLVQSLQKQVKEYVGSSTQNARVIKTLESELEKARRQRNEGVARTGMRQDDREPGRYLDRPEADAGPGFPGRPVVRRVEGVYQDPQVSQHRTRWVHWPALGVMCVMLAILYVGKKIESWAESPPRPRSTAPLAQAAEEQENCDSQWTSTAAVRILESDALTTQSMAQALWIVACGDRREASCSRLDVPRIASELRGRSVEPYWSPSHLSAVQLPDSCRMPTDKPMTLRFEEIEPDASNVNNLDVRPAKGTSLEARDHSKSGKDAPVKHGASKRDAVKPAPPRTSMVNRE